MIVRVLVVDDSRFFRRRVTEMLETDPRIKVIGQAENGSEAIQKSSRLKPDVITMDVEMPVMDGIVATKRILATQKIPILMFSSLTTEGAQATFDALEAGAVDYLPKRFEEISNNKEEAVHVLCERVLSVVKSVPDLQRTGQENKSIPQSGLKRPLTSKPDSLSSRAKTSGTAGKTIVSTTAPIIKPGQFKLLAIGTSTGGPVALQTILSALPKQYALPILLIQHMPGSFTTAFAERLNKSCAIDIAEAKDGDVLQAGKALLAPGGKQMTVEKNGARRIVRIKESTKDQNYKPCVDVTFNSLLKVDPEKTLVVMLTGMGADGCKGSENLKQKGSVVWAQNEKTCVVYGMPGAVVEAGIADKVFSLDDIGTHLARQT